MASLRARMLVRRLWVPLASLCGLTFLRLVDDLRVRPAPTREDAPSLGDCYDAMRAGALDLHGPHGRASMGLALLAQGVAPTEVRSPRLSRDGGPQA